MKIEPLTFADALHIAARLREVDRRECACQSYDASADAIASRCMHDINSKWLIRAADGEPVAMLGISHLHAGLGEAWLLATDRWQEVALSGTKLAIWLREALNLRRIQVHTAAFHTQSHAWLALIGFAREATLRGYGSGGEDFYLMSIVKR